MSDRYFCPLAKKIAGLSEKQTSFSNRVEIVGADPALQDTLRKAVKVARFDEPVLITGESGVGKESLAQAVFLLGPRRGRPFVSVNCPQYQEGNLTVSELFGHTRGSFTGATSERKGVFESAKDGVIFLDEIGDLPMSAQVMLLRALASGEFQPLGSEKKLRVKARVVAATNRPLESELGDHFRGDLFFRLRYFALHIPPLRERGEDWKLLLEYFLRRMNIRHGVTKRFSDDSLELLARYPWPGNVRELSSIATMGYAMSDTTEIEPGDFESLLSGESRHQDKDDHPWVRLRAGESFWDAVHAPYMDRVLNRSQVRRVIERGLLETKGSYRELLTTFHLQDSEYQRFMDFLRHQRLKPE